MATAVEVNLSAACKAVVVTAQHEQAPAWWLKLGLAPFEVGGLELYLLTADIQKTLGWPAPTQGAGRQPLGAWLVGILRDCYPNADLKLALSTSTSRGGTRPNRAGVATRPGTQAPIGEAHLRDGTQRADAAGQLPSSRLNVPASGSRPFRVSSRSLARRARPAPARPGSVNGWGLRPRTRRIDATAAGVAVRNSIVSRVGPRLVNPMMVRPERTQRPRSWWEAGGPLLMF